MSKARHGRAYWTGVITEFERSGQSHERFCERRKLNLGTFRAWLYRLRAEGVTEAPRFVELSADAPVAPAVERTGRFFNWDGTEHPW